VGAAEQGSQIANDEVRCISTLWLGLSPEHEKAYVGCDAGEHGRKSIVRALASIYTKVLMPRQRRRVDLRKGLAFCSKRQSPKEPYCFVELAYLLRRRRDHGCFVPPLDELLSEHLKQNNSFAL